jgi:transcriptional regulator with XRE-family HTH domain
MSAGELLRDARRRHGLTQAQLAARARTSQAAISRIERGLVSPSVATLENLLYLMNEELVLDARAIDWGHDVTLNQESLARTPTERLRYAVSYANFVEELREAATRARR